MTQAREKATDTATPQETLDRTDRQLLDIIQTAFPLAPRPYAVLGSSWASAKRKPLRGVRALKARKIIRRLGANFQSAKLGYVSTLCAAKVPEARMAAFVERVNAEPGVTHNYQREHA